MSVRFSNSARNAAVSASASVPSAMVAVWRAMLLPPPPKNDIIPPPEPAIVTCSETTSGRCRTIDSTTLAASSVRARLVPAGSSCEIVSELVPESPMKSVLRLVAANPVPASSTNAASTVSSGLRSASASAGM